MYLVGNKKLVHPIFDSLPPLPLGSIKSDSPLREQAIAESFELLELWKYDGNLLSTITDDNFQSQPSNLVVSQNALYFTINDEEYGDELCKFDGKNVDVIDIQPGILGSDRRKRMLWRWDGKNTTLVTEDIFNPTDLTVVNNALYFMGENKDKINILWKISAK